MQNLLANRRAKALKLNGRVKFAVGDANRLQFRAGEFDLVWVIESTEHLLDKQRFLLDCARVLRRRGQLALCGWLSTEFGSTAGSNLIKKICDGMLCPSIPKFSDYERWMTASGLELLNAEEMPSRVAKTWEHCEQILRRPIVRACLPLLGRQTRQFTAQFPAMSHAYASGVLSYGMFVARKP